MKMLDPLATETFKDQQEWFLWLEQNGEISKGLWLKIAKKGTGIPSLNYEQALETALSFGWIDGQKAPLDSQYWLQKFTPRKAKSGWSQINCKKAEALIASGRMQAAGLRQVEAAKGDGRWEAAYASQSVISIPPDLQTELNQHPAALAFFSTLDSANRYAVLYRVTTAKNPATRLARIYKLVDMLDKGQKIHP